MAEQKAYPDQGQAYPEGSAYRDPGGIVSADTGKPLMLAKLPDRYTDKDRGDGR